MQGSKKQIRKFYEALLKKWNPEIGRESRRSDIREYLSDGSSSPKLQRSLEHFERQYRDIAMANTGVMCLSETSEELLMWAHYADSHRGVCLVFDNSDPCFSKAKPVRYEHERRVLNILERDVEKLIDYSIFTKSDHWAYEREWRILQTGGAGVYQIPCSALVQVILGAQISAEDQSLVQSWVASAAPSPKLSKAELSKKTFKINVLTV